MRPSTLARLALAGTRTDTLRVLLTALSAVLATLVILAALTVLAVPTPGSPEVTGSDSWSMRYSNSLIREPGLRGGTAFALLLLTIPVLALAGQCARLGAPARDRRLAAIRLAGATPRQAVAVAVAETGLAALLGSAAGLLAYLAGRRLLHRPDAAGRLPLPTDVLPPAPALAAVALGLPLLAALAAALLLRRVTTTPFGVVRRSRRERAPGPLPGLLIGLGVAAFVAIQPVTRWYARHDSDPPSWLVPAVLVGGGLAAMAGVVLGTGWISYHTGRRLRRVARRPAALLAAGRLVADSWAGSRTLAALLAAVIFAGGAAGTRAYFATMQEVRAERDRLSLLAQGLDPASYSAGGADDFYLSTMDLVDLAVLVAMIVAAGGMLVAVAEGIVSRRRAYASLVATGVPRGTLGRSLLWQAVAPAVPAIVLALGTGVLLARGVFGATVSEGGGQMSYCAASEELCSDPATAEQYLRQVTEPVVSRAVEVPVDQLASYGAAALAAVLVTVGVGLLFLRSSTAVEELRTG